MSQGRGKLDLPRTRTWNLRLRRPTPYPLGQQALAKHFKLSPAVCGSSSVSGIVFACFPVFACHRALQLASRQYARLHREPRTRPKQRESARGGRKFSGASVWAQIPQLPSLCITVLGRHQMLWPAETVCPSGLRGWTQVPLAQAAWVQIPQLSILYVFLLGCHHGLQHCSDNDSLLALCACLRAKCYQSRGAWRGAKR